MYNIVLFTIEAYDGYACESKKEKGNGFVKKSCFLFVLTVILALSVLAGCSASETSRTVAGDGLDELGAITVIAREEGSGTRTVFAESLGFYDSNTARDKTTETAKQAESGNAVVEMVSKDASAIGYVSEAALASEEKVHTVTVDGSNLEREFYLAYSGKLSELESDFLTYVLSSGQEIVGKHYSTVVRL